jgi:putative ABC transport system substrate-binding protein
MLKEIAPRVKRVAFLFNPATAPYFEYYLNPFKAAAPSFAVEAIAAPARDVSELESVIAEIVSSRARSRASFPSRPRSSSSL